MDDLFDDEPDEILIVEQTEHEIRRDLPSSTDSKQPPAGDQATDSLPGELLDQCVQMPLIKSCHFHQRCSLSKDGFYQRGYTLIMMNFRIRIPELY